MTSQKVSKVKAGNSNLTWSIAGSGAFPRDALNTGSDVQDDHARVALDPRATCVELEARILKFQERAEYDSEVLARCDLLAARFRARDFLCEAPATTCFGITADYLEKLRDTAAATKVAAAMYSAFVMFKPGNSECDYWEKCALNLVCQHGTVNQCLSIGIVASARRVWQCTPAAPAIDVVSRIRQTVVAESCDGLLYVAWLNALAQCSVFYPDHDPGHGTAALLSEAVARAQKIGIDPDSSPLGATLCIYDLMMGRLDEARLYFQRTSGLTGNLAPYDAWVWSFYKSWFLLATADADAAALEATRGLALAKRSGVPHAVAWAKFALARMAGTMASNGGMWCKIADARNEARRLGLVFLVSLCRLVSAFAAIAKGRSKRACILATSALARIDEASLFRPPFFVRADFERLFGCLDDVRSGVTVAPGLRKFHVIEHTSNNHLMVECATIAEIRCLGGFALSRGGLPLTWSRKMPLRPLELLKATIAQGQAGALVTELTQMLWPNADADRARRAFATALYRLRGILGEQSLVLDGRRLKINRNMIRVDVFDFEDAVAEINLARQGRGQTILDLYSGEFLQGDADSAWVVSARKRLSDRFRRAIRTAGERLLSTGNWRDALNLFEGALLPDPLAEVFYQGALAACLAGGLRAEAASLYDRCKTTLAEQLGLDPATKTALIYRSILQLGR